MAKPVFLTCALWAAATCNAAQPLPFPIAAAADGVALADAMPVLARAVISAYQDEDRAAYLDNLFRLQLVAGQYGQAIQTLGELRALNSRSAMPQGAATNVQYEIFARARIAQSVDGVAFDAALGRIFRDVSSHMDDRTSALLIRALFAKLYPAGLSLHVAMAAELRQALDTQKDRSAIPLAAALRLVRAYQVEEVYRLITPLVPDLVAEDDRRRYTIENGSVETPDGGVVCTLIVRPRSATKPLPTLLEFTIYADPVFFLSDARRSASNGYAGVAGLMRGKGCSPERPVPYEHDGADASYLVQWISKQPWSDGRVGMFGASYTGFTQWAAVKHLPPALKAIMTSVTHAPGIDAPMEGGIFQNASYPWTLYTTTNKVLDPVAYNDPVHWQWLDKKWYTSGKSYRSLDKLDGRPNPVFNQWLEHPSYDGYWRSKIPYGREFSRIRIPVLATTGYYDGGQIGVLHYLTEHYKHDPGAEHYLLVGPYTHRTGNRGTIDTFGDHVDSLDGYRLDPAALIDIGELRYRWFDHVFKGAPKPALLQDRINYQVMGANSWKHAPSLDAMNGQLMRFHLSPMQSGGAHRLAPAPEAGAAITQTVDLADRKDVDRVVPGGGVVDSAIDTWNGVEFVSDPFPEPVEVSGLFRGRLDFFANKKDFDFNIQLYEWTASGEYLRLSRFLARASYVQDRSRRHLLRPNKSERLDFQSSLLMSRQLLKGSRLVAVLSIVKQPSAQINYGTGKDVSDETIADAGTPLTIQWSGASFIDIPIRK